MKHSAFLVVASTLSALAFLVAGCGPCGTPAPGSGKGGLSGDVFYRSAGTPIYVNGATVYIEGTKTYNAVTNDRGTYCRLDIDPSTYRVRADYNGGASIASVTVEIRSEIKAWQDIEVDTSLSTPVAPNSAKATATPTK